jgi:hypothetical protein
MVLDPERIVLEGLVRVVKVVVVIGLAVMGVTEILAVDVVGEGVTCLRAPTGAVFRARLVGFSH